MDTDIETSDQNRDQCLCKAREHLGYARLGTEYSHLHIDEMKRYANQGALTLVEVGTNQDEIDLLNKGGFKREARSVLDYAAKKNDPDALLYLKGLLKKGKIKREEIRDDDPDKGKTKSLKK